MSIAWLCDCRFDTEGGRHDKLAGMRFDRNRLGLLRHRCFRSQRNAVQPASFTAYGRAEHFLMMHSLCEAMPRLTSAPHSVANILRCAE